MRLHLPIRRFADDSGSAAKMIGVGRRSTRKEKAARVQTFDSDGARIAYLDDAGNPMAEGP